mmetsp:Transcript_15310/g.40663  ORF Transcript_15310/g.40663 Transcript_15310/m.40663 type:complete len:286 (+) Transcript_15310:457-1314(+)
MADDAHRHGPQRAGGSLAGRRSVPPRHQVALGLLLRVRADPVPRPHRDRVLPCSHGGAARGQGPAGRHSGEAQGHPCEPHARAGGEGQGHGEGHQPRRQGCRVLHQGAVRRARPPALQGVRALRAHEPGHQQHVEPADDQELARDLLPPGAGEFDVHPSLQAARVGRLDAREDPRAAGLPDELGQGDQGLHRALGGAADPPQADPARLQVWRRHRQHERALGHLPQSRLAGLREPLLRVEAGPQEAVLHDADRALRQHGRHLRHGQAHQHDPSRLLQGHLDVRHV